MRAIVVDRWMEPAALRVREAPEPELAPDTLAVEVRAAGCNFFDLLMVRGQYQVKPPFPFIPGAELAGVVRAAGRGVEGFAAGDRIFASVPLGAFAERAVVPARGAWPMPEGMSFEAGASFPIVYPTSYAGLVFRAGLRRGETLLVHAAAGGVGIAAVQIGKALGARVIATAGGTDKLAVAWPSTTGAPTGSTRCAPRPTATARTSSTIRSGATCSTPRSSASPGTGGSW